jgi:outer membrane protein assembly factor BamB
MIAGPRYLLLTLLIGFSGQGLLPAADRPQWGERFSRNMVSGERGLPDGFDPVTGRNVKWSVALGTECYATPVIAGGKVLIGTNNNQPRDPRHAGDRGVLMCFNEADGRFQWQLVVPKLSEDVYFDWPQVGMCSTPTVEGDRVYMVTNRDEVMCLDLHGMANGNDGPYRDEARHAAPQDRPPVEVGPTDADILWLLDLRTAAGVRPHDSSSASILLDGPYLYVNTSNGLTSRHDGVDKPDAPSLVVVEKATGRLIARERGGPGAKIFHAAWSSPSLGEVGGRRLVFYGGGDGLIYAFAALAAENKHPGLADGTVESLQHVWHFDCDPTAPKENVHRYIRNRREGPSFISGMPVFHDGRIYVTAGGDIWWGKNQAWLHCIDATKGGDGAGAKLAWSYPVERHCCSTPAICDGLAYVSDCGGKVHCVDVQTGRACWVHDAKGEMWASTLVADGKVYVGTRKGDFWVLAAGREKRVLSTIHLDSPIVGTAVAANGTLYLASFTRLYALANTKAP